MSQDVLLSVMNSTTLNGKSVNLEMQRSNSCDKCFDLDAELLKTQHSYNELMKSYSQLEKHCISLELTMQLNQENFQKEKSCDNQIALEIPDYFENNDLKAQLQAKDTTIFNVAKLISENKRLHKEIDHLTSKSVENADLKAQIQDKVFVITSLKNDLLKLKGKEIVENATQIPIATTIAPGMFKLDIEPILKDLKTIGMPMRIILRRQ
ncbi:hypothetical protein Tco_1412024 [Tanacetum coccineum]